MNKNDNSENLKAPEVVVGTAPSAEHGRAITRDVNGAHVEPFFRRPAFYGGLEHC